MKDKVKVLVVEDDINYKQLILTAIEQITNANCIGTASSSDLALRKIQILQPDMVLLNPRFLEKDLLLQQLEKQHHIENSLLICTPVTTHNKTLHLLPLASLKHLSISETKDNQQYICYLMDNLKPLLKLVQQRDSYIESLKTIEPSIITQKQIPHYSVGCYELCVIGISTGGPKALEYLVSQLYTSIQCPIIIVQHMPPLFTASLAMKLNNETQLSVSEAIHGETLCNKHIYIAQGGKHLVLKKRFTGELYLALTKTSPVNNCRPSVDVLFRSVAQVFKGKVLSVIMTGMGQDGMEGVKILKQKGAYCLIQDKNSSVVWGMPGSVHAAGLADEVLPLEQLGSRISSLVV